MRRTSEFAIILNEFLNWNKSRVTCFSQILQGIFRSRTVNLARVAHACDSDYNEGVTYRKFQRFFKGFAFDISCIVIFVLKIFSFNEGYTLIMDRTNWQWGKKNINILMISLEFHGIGVPILWILLDKKGASSTSERITLFKRIIDLLGADKINCFLADREFIGEKWFSYLVEKKIPFVIRVKKNCLVKGLREEGYVVPIGEILKKKGRKKYLLNVPIILWDIPLFASVQFSKGSKEPMIVVSNKKLTNAITSYRIRWSIETLFSCLKTRGFHLEDTHMTDPYKIEKMLFILTVAFCLSLKSGLILHKEAPRVVKSHGRKDKSLFRAGLDKVSGLMMKFGRKLKTWLKIIFAYDLTPLIQER